MRIAVLGSGDLVADIAEQINSSADMTLAAVGYALETADRASGLIALAQQLSIPAITRPSQLDDINVDLVYLHSYPTLISADLLKRHRCINVHYASLPRYRGFHGLVWSIINGESQLGYTIHAVSEGIDDGPVYYQHLFPIDENMNIIDATSHIENHIGNNVLEALRQIGRGLQAIPQDESKAIYVTRRKPEDGLIDWNSPSRLIHNTIRALTPPYTPGAFTHYKGEPLCLCTSHLTDSPSYHHTTGKVIRVKPGYGVWIKTGDSAIEITDVIYRDKLYRADELLNRVGTSLGNKSNVCSHSRKRHLDPVAG
jgi:methionyl-tRNA formyltransferase